MVKVKDIASAIEEAAPLELQEGFDNSGLLVGDLQQEVGSALLCVDITEAVLQEAIDAGCDMVISHHPIIFHPLRHITGRSYIERVVARAIRHGITLYSSHTNLDSAPEGMSHRLGNLLGLRDVSILDPVPAGGAGLGVAGSVEPTPMAEFLAYVKRTLGLRSLRHSDLTQSTVSKVALCTGAGGSLLPKARESGAQLYLAADFRYNDFLDADRELVIADIGHFESEYCAIDLLCDIIRKKIPTFALRKSVRSVNPVNYLV